MMKRKQLFSILITALLLFGVAALLYLIRPDRHEANTPLTEVSVIVDNSTSGRWTRFQAGLEQAAEDYNVSLNYAVTGSFAAIAEEERVIRSEAVNADAVIVQLVDTSDTVELISSLCAERVLGLVETDAPAEAGENFASITADNTAIGTALADALSDDTGSALGSRRIGVLAGTQKTRAMQERLEGFREALAAKGGTITWTVYTNNYLSDQLNEDPVDILIALDNDALEAAQDAADSADIQIYGVGCSDRTIYGLDHGIIKAMIVPDDFEMGYLALFDVVSRVSAPNIPMRHREIPFTLITRDNLFDPGNASFLFPIIN